MLKNIIIFLLIIINKKFKSHKKVEEFNSKFKMLSSFYIKQNLDLGYKVFQF